MRNCQCGGQICRVGWQAFFHPTLKREMYRMTINDGYAHFRCSKCGATHKQKLRTPKMTTHTTTTTTTA